MKMKKWLYIFLSLGLVIVLCGFSESESVAEKLIPVSFTVGVDNESTFLEELEIELTEENPEVCYSGESDGADLFLVFEDIQTDEKTQFGAISVAVTIFSKTGEETFGCGFVDSGAVIKVSFDSNSKYEITLTRGVQDSLDGGEEVVDNSFGKLKIYN